MTNRHNPAWLPAQNDPAFLRITSIAAVLLVAASSLFAQDTASSAPAAAAPAPQAEPISDAVTLLQQARERLAGYRTLKATLAETVQFGPRRFEAEGLYLQGAGRKVRVDLDVQISGNAGHLLQVCDGDVLWTVYEAGPTPRITRRDVAQILAAVKGNDAQSALLAELGLGGLPALLAAVEQSIDFRPPFDAEIEGRKFHVIEGTWKAAIRQQFEAQLQQSPSPPEGRQTLPAHVPELVRIYVDAETLFPYRIRYLKESTSPGVEPSPLLTLDFRDIVVNAPVNPEEFRYTPSEGAQVADITAAYLERLRPQAGQPPQQPSSAPPQ